MMLSDLVKLSKELFEMELVKESIEIDKLISKIYDIGGDPPSKYMESKASVDLPDDDYNLYEKTLPLDQLRELIVMSNDEDLIAGISNILIDSLAIDELELIKEAIVEYLE